MIFATFALGFFCPRHACEERDCGGRCSNETISLRCADTEVIRLVLLQTAGRAGAPARRPPPPPTSTASTALTPAPPLQNFALVLAIVKFAFPGCQGDEMLLPVYILSLWYIISSAWIVAVLRWVVAPRDKGWPCAQPIEDDALAQLRKDAGAGGTMLVTLRDSNAI